MNKYIANAFPFWARKYHKNICDSFSCVAKSHFRKNQEDVELIMGVDHDGGSGSFFSDDFIKVKDGSWFGRSVFPNDFYLNKKMWWYASGWIRSRNQILNGGNWGVTPEGKSEQLCFVGFVKINEVTLQRIKNKLESLGFELSDEQIVSIHDDLVEHYLKNQEVIIDDEVVVDK